MLNAIRAASRARAARRPEEGGGEGGWGGGGGGGGGRRGAGRVTPTAVITEVSTATPTAPPSWRSALNVVEARPVSAGEIRAKAAAWLGPKVGGRWGPSAKTTGRG